MRSRRHMIRRLVLHVLVMAVQGLMMLMKVRGHALIGGGGGGAMLLLLLLLLVVGSMLVINSGCGCGMIMVGAMPVRAMVPGDVVKHDVPCCATFKLATGFLSP